MKNILIAFATLSFQSQVAIADIAFTGNEGNQPTTTPTPAVIGQFPFRTQVDILSDTVTPFVIEGSFKFDTVPNEASAATLIGCLGSSKTPTFEIRYGGGFMHFHLTTPAGTWTMKSQPCCTNHLVFTDFKALVGKDLAQIVVDGVRGQTAIWRTNDCVEPQNAHCVLEAVHRTRPTSTWSVTCAIGFYSPESARRRPSGQIKALRIRSAKGAADKPRRTAYDDSLNLNTNVGKNSDDGGSDGDGGKLVLIFALAAVGVCLLVCLCLGGFFWMSATSGSHSSSHAGPTVAMTAGYPHAAVQVQPARPPTTAATDKIILASAGDPPTIVGSPVLEPAQYEPPPGPPDWWSTRLGKEPELVPTSESVRLSVQDLMNQTWKAVTTRDRKVLGTDSLSRFEVVQVNRNENLKMWQEYAIRRREIKKTLKKNGGIDVLTQGADPALGAADLDSNEFLFFHGTKPSSATKIIENDFLLNLAGSRRGMLYGPGLYFAESSSKADEYADDDKEGIYRGLFAMLLCRVTLGKVYYVDEAFPNGDKLKNACVGHNPQYNSVLGDREKARGTYREFVVYDQKQAYPEYVIVYRRRLITE